MALSILLKGIVIGFSIAAPVGPIGILCIRRTLVEGRATGLASGLGAATADAFYGSVAGFGLTFISALLLGQQFWLRLGGGAFLGYLGLKTLLTKPATEAANAKGNGLLGAYTSTLFLTLTNPATIFSFLAILASVDAATSYGSAALLVSGVFVGSALWWLLLSGSVSSLREKFTPAAMTWVNRASGCLILAFGLVALLSLIRSGIS